MVKRGPGNRPTMLIPGVVVPTLCQRLRPWHNVTQETQYIDPVLIYRWASVADGGPTLNQHQVNPYSAGIDFRRQNLTSVHV